MLLHLYPKHRSSSFFEMLNLPGCSSFFVHERAETAIFAQITMSIEFWNEKKMYIAKLERLMKSKIMRNWVNGADLHHNTWRN